MAKERIAPVALLTSTNYSSITLADVDDDPDNPDGTWGTWDGDGDTIVRLRFGDPSLPLTQGVGLQEYRCLIRKANPGGNAALWQLELRQAGSLIAVLDSGEVISTEGEIVSGMWDAAILGGGTIQVGLQQTGGGVNPDGRGVELGAVVWVAEVTPPHSLAPPNRTVVVASQENMLEAESQNNTIVARGGPADVEAGQ